MKSIQSVLLLCLSIFLFACAPTTPVEESGGTLKTSLKNNTLVFTNAPIGGTLVASFTVKNPTAGQTTISAIRIEDKSKQFELVGKKLFPLVLAANSGGTETITVRYKPTKAVEFQAKLILKTNAKNAKKGEITVILQHKMTMGSVVAHCDGGLDFGGIRSGTTGVISKACRLTNPSEHPLTIGKVSFQSNNNRKDAFVWLKPKLPFTLQPKEANSIEAHIQFVPGNKESEQDGGVFYLHPVQIPEKRLFGFTVIGKTLYFYSRLYAKPIIPCPRRSSCSNLNPSLKCDTTTYRCEGKPVVAFPATDKGEERVYTIELHSTGTSPLHINRISLKTDNPENFPLLLPDKKFPWVLQPKEKVSFQIKYAPKSNLSTSGTLEFLTNASKLPVSKLDISVSQQRCRIKILEPISSRELIFTQEGDSRKIVLLNQGNRVCKLFEPFLKTERGVFAFKASTSRYPILLAPNKTSEYVVTFVSRMGLKNGYRIGAISFSYDAYGSKKEEYTLKAGPFGKPCELTVYNSLLQFPYLLVGSTSKQFVEIRNSGYETCIVTTKMISLVQKTPTNPIAFSFLKTQQFPIKIPPQYTYKLPIQYSPPQERPGYSAVLTLHTPYGIKPIQTVELAGQAGPSCLEVTPFKPLSSLNVGAAPAGCGTPPIVIKVKATGAKGCPETLQLSTIQIIGRNRFGSFHLQQLPTLPKTLKKGEAVQFLLSSKTQKATSLQGIFEIQHSISGQSPFRRKIAASGGLNRNQTKNYQLSWKPELDIVIAIDNTPSMNLYSSELKKKLKPLADWLVKRNAYFRIGVITTDLTDAGIIHSHVRSPSFIDASHSKEPNKLVQNILTAIQSKTSNRSQNKGLDSVYEGYKNSTGLSRSLREGAILALLFISDKDDISSKTVQFYTSFLQQLKSTHKENRVVASVLAGPPPTGCSQGNQKATSATRYWDFAQKMGGVTVSICDKNWPTLLSSPKAFPVDFTRSYKMPYPTELNTVKVTLNKVGLPTTKFRLDTKTNRVILESSVPLKAHDKIQIDYTVRCLP